jgi:hypothetical protein
VCAVDLNLLQDPATTAAALREARARFERGAPAPYAAADLLRRLAAQLAETGPAELGIEPGAWLSALRSAQRGTDALEDAGARQTRQVRRAMRRLEAILDVMQRRPAEDASDAEPLRSPRSALLSVLSLLVVPLALGMFTGGWGTVGIACGVIVLAAISVARDEARKPDVSGTQTWLDLADRRLLVSPVTAKPPGGSERLLPGITRHRRPVLVVTDRRLLLVRRVDGADTDFDVDWSIPYEALRSLQVRLSGGDDAEADVEATADERSVAWTMGVDGGRAVAALVRRHAPQAEIVEPSERRRLHELAQWIRAGRDRRGSPLRPR